MTQNCQGYNIPLLSSKSRLTKIEAYVEKDSGWANIRGHLITVYPAFLIKFPVSFCMHIYTYLYSIIDIFSSLDICIAIYMYVYVLEVNQKLK